MNLKSSLLFSSDSAVLEPAVEQLAQLGDILARYPEDRIVIQGHLAGQAQRSVSKPCSSWPRR